MRLSIFLILTLATTAFAIAPGGKLCINAKDTRVQKEPSAKSAAVITLQPGTEVIWNGVSEKDKEWHSVQASGRKGFVRRSELSPNCPQLEVDSTTGKQLSQAAFASSGAAVKDGPRTVTYAHASAADQTAAAELIYVEQLNQAKATPAALVAKNQELHQP